MYSGIQRNNTNCLQVSSFHIFVYELNSSAFIRAETLSRYPNINVLTKRFKT